MNRRTQNQWKHLYSPQP